MGENKLPGFAKNLIVSKKFLKIPLIRGKTDLIHAKMEVSPEMVVPPFHLSSLTAPARGGNNGPYMPLLAARG